jgi:hypothetical protein
MEENNKKAIKKLFEEQFLIYSLNIIKTMVLLKNTKEKGIW